MSNPWIFWQMNPFQLISASIEVSQVPPSIYVIESCQWLVYVCQKGLCGLGLVSLCLFVRFVGGSQQESQVRFLFIVMCMGVFFILKSSYRLVTAVIPQKSMTWCCRARTGDTGRGYRPLLVVKARKSKKKRRKVHWSHPALRASMNTSRSCWESEDLCIYTQDKQKNTVHLRLTQMFCFLKKRPGNIGETYPFLSGLLSFMQILMSLWSIKNKINKRVFIQPTSIK